ncbi:division/cell wall cluster transcriptional repressor MraZ [Zophobihabitans entericus]|uniref:Transcriptional regulator MraZ n=1 Tax=Zophobihabitans entericus TaxID=1635327 RepID=A0A6G9I9S2_9GAMM|nr:division/cell wall cluster transcriptional repressor MraZ [Zophobihabitans entericus]QIQ20963.1 division/cell wall cluster transcriptional repressor MraZ [Zophobihabitans entericus]
MFRGATAANLDNKGRLAIPTRYREALTNGLVCTVDLYQPCLLLYPLAEWEVIEQKLATLSSMNPVERRIQRLLLGHATECQMDNAGRILIAGTLRQHANLDKSIMLVGQLNKFELWDETRWQQQIAQDIALAPEDLHQLSDKLQNLTI